MERTPTGSRRLTGPNLFLDSFGVALEAPLRESEIELAEQWRQAVQALWNDLGWGNPTTTRRAYGSHTTLAASVPEDVLYTACEALETAWAQAVEACDGEAARPPAKSFADLGRMSAEERSPRRLQIADLAAEHGVRFFADDEFVSVGSGVGCQVWPVDGLPAPDQIDWASVSDIPVALVTGTNGKTTTVRMLAAIARAAGLTAGNTSTDGVELAGRTILEGDYTGGEGARALMRDSRVEVAFLEVARGGMLRRGLPVERADVAYVSNIGTDHLGEYGIESLDELAQVKLIVGQAVQDSGELVLNADDPVLLRVAADLGYSWDGVSAGEPASERDPAFLRRRGRLGVDRGKGFVAWMEQADAPATLGGVAVHNVYNALGAMAVADRLGLSRAAITDGLASFRSDPATNPGRLNHFQFGGMSAIVDYAHNPEGLDLVMRMARDLDPRRLLVVIGQAGDRDDASIAAMVNRCAAAEPDKVIVKTMEKYGRGRDPHQVADLVAQRFRDAGLPEAALGRANDELTAVMDALRWGRDGDLLLLLSHAARVNVLQLMQTLIEQDWHPGQELPEPDRSTV
ncbi:MAG: hypothetical protein GKS06_06240 [Acidobacteria bacterium]|nr:hypothetical protein [Acidobacteriota bacterium]